MNSDERRKGRSAFVGYVRVVCRDPGTRATLRRGLGKRPTEVGVRTHSIVVRHLPEGLRDDGPEERAYYTVAALIAAQPRSARDDERDPEAAERTDPTEPPDNQQEPKRVGDLGASLAMAVNRGELGGNSAESHLRLLVRQPIDTLHRRLPGLIRQLRGDRVPVNWVKLLDDLADYAWNQDRITKRWIQSYYRTLKTNADRETADVEQKVEA